MAISLAYNLANIQMCSFLDRLNQYSTPTRRNAGIGALSNSVLDIRQSMNESLPVEREVKRFDAF